MHRVLSVLLFLAACGPVRSGPGVLVEERVALRLVWYDFHEVPARYAISSEMVAPPYYVLLSESGRFCPVSEAVYREAVEGLVWPCRWHTPRGLA
jgi:hypothetical protein